MGLDIGQIRKATNNDEDLVRRAGLFIGNLTKQGVDPITLLLEVIVLLDISSSMDDEFADGSVQEMLMRALAYAATISNSGTVRVVAYGQRAHELEVINLKNYRTYFKSRGTAWNRKPWYPTLEGATRLGLGMQKGLEVAGRVLGNSAVGDLGYQSNPAGVLTTKGVVFMNITDGFPNDLDLALRVQVNSADCASFWNHSYCSNQEGGWPALKSLDNVNGRRVDNSNASRFRNIRHISDEEYAEAVTKDFGPWSRYVSNPEHHLLVPAAA